MVPDSYFHNGVIKWNHFPCYWPLVWGIHRSPVNSPRKGQWRGALMIPLIYAWTNGLVNNRDAGGLRRHRAHYSVTVMSQEMPENSISDKNEITLLKLLSHLPGANEIRSYHRGIHQKSSRLQCIVIRIEIQNQILASRPNFTRRVIPTSPEISINTLRLNAHRLADGIFKYNYFV